MKVHTDLRVGQGLGDIIDEITNLTGIDQLAKGYENLTGQSCGCDERRQKLNMLFPLSSIS